MFMLQSKEWTGFNRAFYKKLLMVFGVFTLLAGVVQLALGAYVFDKVRSLFGPTERGRHVSHPRSNRTKRHKNIHTPTPQTWD